METPLFRFHRRALIALNQLPEDERTRIRERLELLVQTPLRDWPMAGAKKLHAETSLYLVRVDDSLRLIVRAGEGEMPEVQDVVRHETLEMFARIGNEE